MRRAVAVSPHLDDAAFSAGGVLAGLAAAGWDVALVTVFTATVPEPTGFALACQTDKGFGPEVDYMALRRDEDHAAAAVLGLGEVVHLPLPEAPHRGYGSPAELFGRVRDGGGEDGDERDVPAARGQAGERRTAGEHRVVEVGRDGDRPLHQSKCGAARKRQAGSGSPGSDQAVLGSVPATRS